MLKSHDRYDYSSIVSRPDYSWPGGKRLAVYVAVNVEHASFGEGLGSDLAVPTPPPNHRSFAWRDYGNRVGFWRLLDLLGEFAWPTGMLINTELYDYAPEIMEAIRARGDEVVGHGRSNAERQGDMSVAAEAAMIKEATATIVGHEGRQPEGWLSPYISETWETPDVLKENGYTYLLDWPCDDQPIWLRTRAGPILSVPYPLEVNDSVMMVFRRVGPAEFADMIIDTFDEMRHQSEKQPLVFGISLHTFVVGQPYRLRQLRRAFRHIDERSGDMWITRPGDIARHVAGLPAGTVPGG